MRKLPCMVFHWRSDATCRFFAPARGLFHFPPASPPLRLCAQQDQTARLRLSIRHIRCIIPITRSRRQAVLTHRVKEWAISDTGFFQRQSSRVPWRCSVSGQCAPHAHAAPYGCRRQRATCTCACNDSSFLVETQRSKCLGYHTSGPVCGERTLTTAQKLPERTNRAGIISICPLHNIVGV